MSMWFGRPPNRSPPNIGRSSRVSRERSAQQGVSYRLDFEVMSDRQPMSRPLPRQAACLFKLPCLLVWLASIGCFNQAMHVLKSLQIY